MKNLSILFLVFIIVFQPPQSYAAETTATSTVKTVQSAHYRALTAEEMESLLSLNQSHTRMSAQLAGDCHTTCEWDPIAKENVCDSHCDPDNSGAPSSGGGGGGPMTTGQKVFLTVALIVIGIMMISVFSQANAATAGGPPG